MPHAAMGRVRTDMSCHPHRMRTLRSIIGVDDTPGR